MDGFAAGETMSRRLTAREMFRSFSPMNSRTRILRVGSAIRTARRKRDMSQFALTELVGISEGYLSRLERGNLHNMPSSELLIRLCSALDLDYNELMQAGVDDQIRLGEVVN